MFGQLTCVVRIIAEADFLPVRAAGQQGKEADLLGKLADTGKFPLTKEEAKELLEPSKYIGRCPEQVERFLKETAPLYEEAGSIDDELNV